MEIVELPISEIKPYPKNAKEHPEKQIKKIANSIKEFGFNQPIVIDKDKVIIVGHGRFIAALSLAMEKVPTLTVELDEERAKAYRLADNRTAQETDSTVRPRRDVLLKAHVGGDVDGSVADIERCRASPL